MQLAETIRSHWVLALASVALVGSAIAVAPTAPPSKAAVVKKTTVKPWRSCKHRQPIRQAAVAAPKAEVTGADYRRVLMRAQKVFEACTKQSPSGVSYQVKASISADGRVNSVEVRGEHPDLSRVSMRVVACMEQTMSKLHFPATGADAAVTTTFKSP